MEIWKQYEQKLIPIIESEIGFLFGFVFISIRVENLT